MPTYDYLCPNGHRFEVIHSLTASGPEACPVCGAAPVRKAFTAPSVHFKGSGWAKKDRSSVARSAAAASTGSDSTSDTGSSAGSSEGQKPAAESGSDSTGDKKSTSTDSTKSSKSSTSSGTAAAD
jgi:putative FmdB family regulatory protein